jgi:threonine/homoserine/homoserine lactone efflux protein
LLAWLGVQAMRAEQAGDAQEAQRIRRRMQLVSN